jgi:hypothetical protein
MKTSNLYEAKLMALSGKVYERLLLLYPLEHRREYGAAMAQLFRDQCREAWTEARGWGLVVLWFRIWSDLVRTAAAEHFRDLKQRKSMFNKALSAFRNVPTEKSELLRFSRWLCSWHGVRTILMIVVLPVALVTLLYGFENWRGSRAWKQCQQELRAKGAVLDLSALVPKHVPKEGVLADTPLIRSWFDKKGDRTSWNDPYPWAQELLQRHGLDNSRRVITDLVAWQMAFAAVTSADSNKAKQEFSVPRSDATLHANAAKEVLKHLETLEPLFSELRQLSSQPGARWPVDYSKPWSLDMHSQFNLVIAGQRLGLKTSAELATGQTEQAREDIRLLLALGDSLEQEPFLFSNITRWNLLRNALQTLWEGVRLHQWTTPDLERFQGQLAKYNIFEGIALCWQGERAVMLRTLDYFRTSGRLDRLGDAGDPWPGILGKFCPRGWYDFEKVSYCRFYELTTTKGWDAKSMRISPKEVEWAQDQLARLRSSSSIERLFEHRVLAWQHFASVSGFAQLTTASQTYLNQAVIACALERYWLAKGVYPETLDTLTDAGLVAIMPRDLFTGEPMSYQRVADNEYALYSVGWNAQDDGGKPGETTFDLASGDWLW